MGTLYINIGNKFSRFLLLFIILFSEGVFLYANESEPGTYKANKWVLDVPEDWTIDSVLNNEEHLSKADFPETFLSTNDQPKPIWVEVEISNKEAKENHLLVHVSNLFINELDFYEVSEDSHLINVKYTGEKRVKKPDIIQTRHYFYNVKLQSKQHTRIFVRVNNLKDVTYIPIHVNTYLDYLVDINRDNILLAGFYGVLILILILNFSIYFGVKEREFFYYFIYVFCLVIYFLNQDGISFTYFWPNYPTLSNRSLPFILASLNFFLVVFSQCFFKLQETHPFYNKVFVKGRYIILIVGFSAFLGEQWSVMALYLLVIMMLIIYGSIVHISLILAKKDKMFYIVTFTFLLWTIGMIMYLLRDYGKLKDNFFIDHVFRLVYLFEAISMFVVVLESHRRNMNAINKSLVERNVIIKNQNEILERQNEELNKLYAATNETDSSIAFFDESQNLLWCNKKFISLRRLSHFSGNLEKERYQIHNFYTHFNNIDDLINQAEKSSKPQKFEWQLKSKNEEVWLHTNLTPLTSGRKKTGIITVDTDITTLKNYEKELIMAKAKAEESDNLKSAFLANMSHEIRTPMNAIFGFCHLLRRDLDKEKRNNYINVINANGEYLIKLIDDIIDISKIEAGQLEINNEWFDVDVLFEDIQLQIEHYTKNYDKEHLEIAYNVSNNIKKVYSDKFRMQQVLINLLTNAIKFTNEGYVKYGVYKEDDNLVFYVKDSGIGIDKKHHNEIFERFIKVSASNKVLYRGTGIGLSISKHIVYLLKGDVTIESELGKGSTFYIKIPSLTPENKEIEESVSSVHVKNNDGLTVLIAEDENDSFVYLKEILESKNYKVLYAENGKEAVDIVESTESIDLILMDLKMPEMSGYEAAKIIKQKFPNKPIIAQTAHAMREEKEKILEAGFDDYISKPIKEHLLLTKMNRFFK